MDCKLKQDKKEIKGKVEVDTSFNFKFSSKDVKMNLPISRRSYIRITGKKTVDVCIPEMGEEVTEYPTISFAHKHDLVLFSHAFLKARFNKIKAKPKAHIYECSLSEVKKKRTVAIVKKSLVIVEDGKSLISIPLKDVKIEEVDGARVRINGITLRFSSSSAAHIWSCLHSEDEYISSEFVTYKGETCELRLAGCYASLFSVDDDDDDNSKLIAVTPIPHTMPVETEGVRVRIDGLGDIKFSDSLAARSFALLLGAQPQPKDSDIVVDIYSEAGAKLCSVRFDATRYTSVFCAEVVFRVAEALGLDEHSVDLSYDGHYFAGTPLACPSVMMPNGGRLTLVAPRETQGQTGASLRLSMEILKATYRYAQLTKGKGGAGQGH